jgi:hypothetical protein
MRISRPSTGAWIAGVCLGVAGLLMRFGVLHVTGLGIDPFWFVSAAFLLLALSPVVKGL